MKDDSRLVECKTEKDAEEEKTLTPTKPSSKPISSFFGENLGDANEYMHLYSCINGATTNLCCIGICLDGSIWTLLHGKSSLQKTIWLIF